MAEPKYGHTHDGKRVYVGPAEGQRTLYHRKYRNADGTAMRVRISGRVQEYKRTPSRDRIPIKHGLYDHGYIDRGNVHEFSATEPPPKRPRRR